MGRSPATPCRAASPGAAAMRPLPPCPRSPCHDASRTLSRLPGAPAWRCARRTRPAAMRVHLPGGPASAALRAWSHGACAAIEEVYAAHGMRARLRGLLVRWNMRFTTTAGRAWYRRNEIQLAGRLWPLATDAQRRSVAAHEAAHLVAFHAYGHTGHGEAWKHVLRTAGFEPRRQHDIASGLPVSCGCAGVVLISAQRVRRLLRGARYRCDRCLEQVQPSTLEPGRECRAARHPAPAPSSSPSPRPSLPPGA